MKDLTKISIDRIYKTAAYDALNAFCDDDQGGDSSFMLCDKYDKQQVVNLLVPIIRREEREKSKQNVPERCNRCKRVIDEGDEELEYGRDGTPYCKHCGYHKENDGQG